MEEQIKQEYPYEVWVLWDPECPEDGSELREKGFETTPERVLAKANAQHGSLGEILQPFGQAQLMRSKLPYEELRLVPNRALYIAEIGPTIRG
jgi:hypothetical protein